MFIESNKSHCLEDYHKAQGTIINKGINKSSPINTLYEQLSFIQLHQTDKKGVKSSIGL